MKRICGARQRVCLVQREIVMLAMILATGLVASGGAAASSESLRLTLSAPAEIMVGEPTKLRMAWTAVRDLEVEPEKVQVWLDRGTGFRPYHETSFGTAWTVYFHETLERGSSLSTEQVIAVSRGAGAPEDGSFELAFPRPGRYRARVQYEGLVSNVVTIEAILPKGKDYEVLAQLLRRPALLSEWGLIEDFGGLVLEKLLAEYPTSRYLAHPRVLSWRKELEEARAADVRSGARAVDGKTGQLLARLEDTTLDGTQFEEDRLVLMGDIAASIGDRAKARATYERILSLFPPTAAATKAKGWLTLEDQAVSRDRVQ
jgi:hypothetical protein